MSDRKWLITTGGSSERLIAIDEIVSIVRRSANSEYPQEQSKVVVYLRNGVEIPFTNITDSDWNKIKLSLGFKSADMVDINQL